MINSKIPKNFKNLIELLKIEKQEDLRLYKLKVQNNSLIERRNKGVCWYPVQLEKTRYDAGERLLVRVSRNPEHIIPHLFQSGKLVSIFSNSNNNTENTTFVNGVVNQVSELEMIITLNCEKFPQWLNNGKLGIQLLFDENTYNEMNKILNYLLKNENKEIEKSINIILDDEKNIIEQKYFVNHNKLNNSQNKALNLILNSENLAIIHGPPGTGKTTTLIYAIEQTLKYQKQVLVTAPSNAAVDLLVEKLVNQGINTVRIGHPARVTENILNTTLDLKITRHKYFKDLRMVRRKTEELYKAAKKYKRNFNLTQKQKRRELFAQAREMKNEAKHLKFYITNDILDNAQVIASTMIGAANVNIKNKNFKTVFIDEAAQGLEPATWIPVTKAEKVVMAGDHHQLPPTVKSFEAAQNGLDVTLFEKAIKNNKADIMLKEQYRMHQKIMNFSNSFFYKNQLKANEKVANHLIFADDNPLEFIDTAGTGFIEEKDPETLSTFNKEEVNLLFIHFKNYLNIIKNNDKLQDINNIGIISPYKAQVILLQEFFKNIDINEILKKKISINTIDSFQGQERDIIYISLVRSNTKSNIGFLSDIRRMNVAMTRAKKKLVVIGNSATICKNKFYNQFFDYINQIDAYKSAYEFL